MFAPLADMFCNNKRVMQSYMWLQLHHLLIHVIMTPVSYVATDIAIAPFMYIWYGTEVGS